MPLLNLPTELILNIFSHVGYWDLRLTIPLVCHLFREIILENSNGCVIGSLLFTQCITGAPSLSKGTDVTFHPLFGRMSYRCQTTVDEVYMLHQNHNGTLKKMKLEPLQIGKENATSPPVKRMLVRAGYSDPVAVEGDAGRAVNVTQVMEGLVQAFCELYRSLDPLNEQNLEMTMGMNSTFRGVDEYDLVDGVLNVKMRFLPPKVCGKRL